MLHNLQTVLQQICKSYLRYQTIKYIDIFSKPDCNIKGKNLYLKMLENYRTRTGTKIFENDHLIVFGDSNIVQLNLVQKLAIQAFNRENISVFTNDLL